jgi:hypothetical protein
VSSTRAPTSAPETLASNILTDYRYKVDSYNIKLIKHQMRRKEADIYQLKICLKRHQDEVPPEELAHIPTPKQMDDWEIFCKLLALQAYTVKEDREQTGPGPGYNTPLASGSGLNSIN